MGRRLAATVFTLVSVTVLTGCASAPPPGVDGNLTNNWPAMPEAKVSVPVVGVCYPGQYVYPGRSVRVWTGFAFNTVDCSTTHYSETVFIGSFAGADAQRSTTPDIDSPAMVGPYGQCGKAASDYLGGDLHTGLVWLQMEVPTNAAWRGGARWFRCDLVHLADALGKSWVDHGSLRGDLAGPRTAGYGCLATTEESGKITNAQPVDCALPHAAEFAGLFTAPDVPFPDDQTAWQQMLDTGCDRVVAGFLGFANVSQSPNPAVGSWGRGWTRDQWTLGDRTTQCFAYAFTKSGRIVGSVKDIRNQIPRG